MNGSAIVYSGDWFFDPSVTIPSSVGSSEDPGSCEPLTASSIANDTSMSTTGGYIGSQSTFDPNAKLVSNT